MVCVGCLAPLKTESRCPGCRVLLCEPACTGINLHNSLECQFVRMNFNKSKGREGKSRRVIIIKWLRYYDLKGDHWVSEWGKRWLIEILHASKKHNISLGVAEFLFRGATRRGLLRPDPPCEVPAQDSAAPQPAGHPHQRQRTHQARPSNLSYVFFLPSLLLIATLFIECSWAIICLEKSLKKTCMCETLLQV